MLTTTPAPVGRLTVSLRPATEAYDYDYVAQRLADPALLAGAVAVCVFRAPLVAVPVGGARRGGYLSVAELSPAVQARSLLAGRHGFPDISHHGGAGSPHATVRQAGIAVGRPAHAGAAGPAYERDQTAAAAETVALALDEDSPLPEMPADVEDLARRLRGHIMQLSIAVPPHEPAVRRAQQLASAPPPDGYVPSRVHLVQLAEATQELVVIARTHKVERVPPSPCRPRRWRKPQINTLRGTVFAVAFALLVLAASLPRT